MVDPQLSRSMELRQQEVQFATKHCFHLAFRSNYHYDLNRLSFFKNIVVFFPTNTALWASKALK